MEQTFIKELGQFLKLERVTIVTPVEVAGINKFAEFVRQTIPGYQIPYTHVTLMKSAESGLGIRLDTAKDVAKYCQSIRS